MTKKTDLLKTKWGFYQYFPLPSEKELERHYSTRYYQEGLGSYAKEYDQEELYWWNVRAELVAISIEKLINRQKVSFLDVGCGEGWTLNAMYKRGHQVKGIDFSIAGINKFNKHLLPFFEQGNIYTALADKILEKTKYDVVFLGNVLEHVVDPEKLLQDIRLILASEGILAIVVPNDFSDLQESLAEMNSIPPWWLFYPEHISYFNHESMQYFLNAMDFELLKIQADFPMEFSLFTELTNYVQDRSKGKEVHRLRMRIDNYLFGKDPEKMRQIYSLLGDMGVGRNLIYFCKAK